MARSIERGTDYKNITKVIMINILGYNIFEYEEYVSKTVTVLDKHREYEVMDDIIYYFIELKKFRKQQANMDDKLNQWLAVIDDTDRGRIKMAETKNKILQRARTEINYIAGDASQRRIIELREKWEMDRISAINYAEERGEIRGEKRGERRGLIRGEKRGQKQAKEKIAKNLLKQNIDIEIIISATGLTKEQIEILKMN